jgi:MazG family protein
MSSPIDPEPAPIAPFPEVDGVLDRSLALVEFLRRHCPWDAAQTPRSLIPYLLEEAHETADAITNEDTPELEGELGDLLLNVAFQIVLGEEAGSLSRDSVVQRMESKMIRRHPHLFGLGEKEDWEVLKAREKTHEDEGILTSLARGLDPLLKAHRMQEKVSGVGFDWEDGLGAWKKVAEELEEVREAMEEGSEEALEEELGDLLFSVVNLTRLKSVHAATALEHANAKFRRRFEALERIARGRGIDLQEADVDALEALWEEVKAAERG